MHDTRTIWLHAEAPPKPAAGAPCNGCGVCCASEPCPVGIVVSGRLRGACRVLAWNATERRYRCGLLPVAAAATGPTAWKETLLRRWIGAGIGCDSAVDTDGERPTAI